MMNILKSRNFFYVFLSLVILSANAIWAQEELSLDIIVTKDPSGEGIPRYASGDALRIGISVSQDAYVYLFEIDDTDLIAIYPNQYDPEQHKFFRADELYTVPPSGADYEFILNDLEAERRIVGVATPNPLAPALLNGLGKISDLQGGVWALDEVRFAVGDNLSAGSLANRSVRVTTTPRPTEENSSATQADNIVTQVDTDDRELLTPVTNSSNTSDADVEQQNDVEGNFRITSIPAGAEVFVDDVRMGITPLLTNVEAGVRVVTLRLVGYQEVNFPLEVRAEQDSIVETYLVEDPDSVADIDSADTTTPSGLPDVAAGSDVTVPSVASEVTPPVLQDNRVNLIIQTNTDTAEIYLDGNRIGRVNAAGELTLHNIFAGERLISIRAAGFQGLEERRYFAAGEHVVELNLSPVQTATQTNTQQTTVVAPAVTDPNAVFSTEPIPTTPTTSTAPTQQVAASSSGSLSDFASPTFNLRNYPEARLLNIVESMNRSDSYLQSIVPVANLYAFFESQLVGYGWQQVGINETANVILGDYRQGNYNLRMEVSAIGTNLSRLTLYRY